MKRLLKTSIDCVASVVVLPAVVLYRLGAVVRSPERALAGWSQLFSLFPGSSGEILRRAFYRRVLGGCGSDVCLSFGSLFSHPAASLGDRVYVGPYSLIGSVTVEEDVLIGSHVSVMNGTRQHGIERLDLPIREQPGECPRVTIGRGSWIGERAIVAADVGRHCVVGAGAVVLRPVPDYAVAAGVPARVLRFRNESMAHKPPAPAARPRETALPAL